MVATGRIPSAGRERTGRRQPPQIEAWRNPPSRTPAALPVAIRPVAAPEPTVLQWRQLTLPTAYTLPFALHLERATPHAHHGASVRWLGTARPTDRSICEERSSDVPASARPARSIWASASGQAW